MKKIHTTVKTTFALLAAGSIVTACGIQNKADDDGFMLDNDEASLASRIVKVDRELTVEEPAEASLGLNRFNISYSLRLVGEMEAPVIDGHRLQATDIYSDGGYAYVSYNFADDPKRGGLEVLNVSDETNPQVISSLLYRDSDFNALWYNDGHIYIAGADNHTEPAFLRKFKLSDTDNTLTGDVQTVRLTSHAGNDVAVSGDHVATTSGSNGHLSIFNKDDLSLVSSIQKNNLRSVKIDRVDGTAWALIGENGTAIHHKITGEQQSEPVVMGGANQDQAKSTIGIGRKTMLTALNEEGAKIICKSTGEELAHIPVNNPDGLDDTKAVTNAVAMYNGFMFAANGEAGVTLYIVRTSFWDACNIRSITKQGRIDFGSGFSANHVFYSRGHILVADGTGGIKILRITRGNGSDSDENDRDQDEDDSDNVTICKHGRKTMSLPRRAAMANVQNGTATWGACGE